MMRSAVLAVTDRSVTRGLITQTPVGKAVAQRFIAGDELADAIAVASSLNDRGMAVSLDHLGEHVSRIDDAKQATASYRECLIAIDEAGLDANISVKLTQLGMGLDDRVATANLDELAGAAARIGRSVTVDMEESQHTQATIDIYEQVQNSRGNLGIAVQAYLHQTATDLDRIIPLGGHIRLCKGAYAEPAEIAFQSRGEVDQSFDRLAALLMHSRGVIPAIASHDDDRIGPVLDLAHHRDGSWEFQMLFGVRRDRQRELVEAGHQVRVYVPYGSAWYPYFSRRLAERPANLTFFARALLGR